jgi:hypothetical protein
MVDYFVFFLDNSNTDAFRLAPLGICSICPPPLRSNVEYPG